MSHALVAGLRKIIGAEGVADADAVSFRRDATEAQGLEARPDAVVTPADRDQVAAVVSWCYARDVPIVPRGGGTGFAGGAVPVHGGVVVDLRRLTRVRSFDPLLWRIHVEAGLRTAHLRRLARENGLLFPPDPGAAEQSQIGGNIATNAGGPHAFKYGVTGRWITGLEAVVPPGEIVKVGGPVRKDVAGYDIGSLLVGSEGTLGIITAAWLRLMPAPEAALPVVGIFRTSADGCAAVEAILGSGIQPAAIEFLDAGALDAARGSCPFKLHERAAFMVLVEADGRVDETARTASELREALAPRALAIQAPCAKDEIAALWRWRDGISMAVSVVHGGKVSEDIAVPIERLEEAVQATTEIGARYGLKACSWGHAGDGNLHSTFLVDPGDARQLERAHAAAADLYAFALAMDGTISGEHGLGWVKRGHLKAQWNTATLELHRTIKRMIDPKNLMNPGKKT